MSKDKVKATYTKEESEKILNHYKEQISSAREFFEDHDAPEKLLKTFDEASKKLVTTLEKNFADNKLTKGELKEQIQDYKEVASASKDLRKDPLVKAEMKMDILEGEAAELAIKLAKNMIAGYTNDQKPYNANALERQENRLENKMDRLEDKIEDLKIKRNTREL